MKTFKNKKKFSGKKNNSKLKYKKYSKRNGQYKKYSKLKGGSNVSIPSIFGKQRTDLFDNPPILKRPPISLRRPSTTRKILEKESIEKEKIEELKQQIKNEINTFIDEFKIEPETPNKDTSLELVELNNQFCQIKINYYDKNDGDKYKPVFFMIYPDHLSVDKLQYFINSDKITVTDDNHIHISENTIALKSLKTGGQYRSGGTSGYNEYNTFITVYENMIPLIPTESTIPMIKYAENLKSLNDESLFFINVMDVKYESEDNKFIIKKRVQSKLKEDVTWLKAIMDDLNKKDSEPMTRLKRFFNLSGDELNTTRVFTCADLNVDHSKLIIEVKDEGDIPLKIGDEEYVIVGYPKESMRPYIDLYNKNKAEFDAIYEDHKRNFMEYMAGLHNTISENKIDIEKLSDEIHKFYDYESYYKYIEDFYKNSPPGPSKLISNEEFQNKFKELQKAFYNTLANKCLNKPMMTINYVFLIFKKLNVDSPDIKKLKGDYVPAIFNFRELTNEHHKILKRLEYCIKTRLSKIYGIVNGTEDYKLYYSHYNYGDVFHIKTEYVHTMSNIQQQAYKYSNSITLEEIIYMLSQLPPGQVLPLKNLRVEYQRKKVNFVELDGKILSYPEGLATTSKVEPNYNLNIEDIDITPKLLDTTLKDIFIDSKKLEVAQSANTDLDLASLTNTNLSALPLPLEKSKILLMFVQTGKIYTFVYERNKIFYIIKFKPELYNCIKQILTYLKNVIKVFDKENIDQIWERVDMERVDSIDIPEVLNLYKVLEHRLLTPSDYKNIMRYNPLIFRTIKKRTNEPHINISEFFISPLVKIESLPNYNILIPNPYSTKPFIILNILYSEDYKREFNEFKKKINKNIYSHSYRPLYNLNFINLNNINANLLKINKEYINNIINILDSNYMFSFNKSIENKILINRIYFNPLNCKYNFIELNENNNGISKSIVWIVPLNSTAENINNNNSNNSSSNNKKLFNEIPIFLNNFIDLQTNHLLMLKILNLLYYNKIQSTFFNIGSISQLQLSLHAQVFNNEHYKSNFANYEQGSRLSKFVNTKIIMNFLNLSKIIKKEYYNNYNCNALIHDKQ